MRILFIWFLEIVKRLLIFCSLYCFIFYEANDKGEQILLFVMTVSYLLDTFYHCINQHGVLNWDILTCPNIIVANLFLFLYHESNAWFYLLYLNVTNGHLYSFLHVILRFSTVHFLKRNTLLWNLMLRHMIVSQSNVNINFWSYFSTCYVMALFQIMLNYFFHQSSTHEYFIIWMWKKDLDFYTNIPIALCCHHHPSLWAWYWSVGEPGQVS